MVRFPPRSRQWKAHYSRWHDTTTPQERHRLQLLLKLKLLIGRQVVKIVEIVEERALRAAEPCRYCVRPAPKAPEHTGAAAEG